MIDKLSWLGGLWDGEGTITVWRGARESGKERYIPTLVLTNTNESIIAEAVKILDEMNVKMFLHTVKHDNERHKDAYQLTTRKLESVKRFCDTMIPYLIGKKPQAELTLRFVNSRLKSFEKNKSWSQRNEYNEEEVSLSEQLIKLNRKGKSESPETKR